MSEVEKLVGNIQSILPDSILLSMVDLSGSINHEMIRVFEKHLRRIASRFPDGKIPKLVLLLHTYGGNQPAARAIGALLKEFTSDFQVIVPIRAMSSGTLLSLAANKIWMSSGSLLSPIDPTIESFAGKQFQKPVSVEDLKALFFETELSAIDRTEIVKKIINQGDPLALGQALRAHKQIKRFAKEFLSERLTGKELLKTVNLLTGEWGTHDNPITREDARTLFKLPVEDMPASLIEASQSLVDLLKQELSVIENQTIIEVMKKVKYGQCQAFDGRHCVIHSEIGGMDILFAKADFYKVGFNDRDFQQIGYKLQWKEKSMGVSGVLSKFLKD